MKREYEFKRYMKQGNLIEWYMKRELEFKRDMKQRNLINREMKEKDIGRFRQDHHSHEEELLWDTQ
jgi:hypothetical protein